MYVELMVLLCGKTVKKAWKLRDLEHLGVVPKMK